MNFSRFDFLNTTLWYACFALALSTGLLRHRVVGAVIVLQIFCIAFSDSKYNDFKRNLAYTESLKSNLTYEEFFLADLFQQIKLSINYQNEPVIAVALHPSILQFNGFTTLDGYISKDPLEDKYRFRKLIAPQLEKNEAQRNYYDNWDGRKYIFYDGPSWDSARGRENCTIETLRISISEFSQMGGRYIMPACEVVNSDDLGLSLVRKFEDGPNTPYSLYVYQPATHLKFESN